MPAIRRGSHLPKAPMPDEIPFGPAFFERLLDNLYDGVYFVDRARRILFWNKGAEQLTGYTRDDVLGSRCQDQILDHVDGEGCHLCRDQCPLAATVEDGEPRAARVFLHHKDRRRIAIDVHVMPMRNDQGEIIGGVEVFRDASPSVALEHAYRRLRTLAERDPLTGAANRRSLDSTLAEQLQVLGRTGIPFSVIMIDIDHFKQINDTWGHTMGDLALVRFAHSLEAHCRGGDVAGRFGGEEFLVILPGAPLKVAARVAERVRKSVPKATPPEVDMRKLTASFGVAEAALADTPETLLARADAALYRAKHSGRDRVELQEQPAPAPRPPRPAAERRRLPVRNRPARGPEPKHARGGVGHAVASFFIHGSSRTTRRAQP
jgi:diguanylate cyclase (GGDEF)-like protein/PAS domain S-box-containing protein